MKLTFYKYQGTGNDFVMIDNRQRIFPKKDSNLVSSLCDRRFGIGADGLILLEEDPDSGFGMVYYNADGNEGSLCGNGGRCFVTFAKHLGLIEDKMVFRAADGAHEASVTGDIVSLKMQDVSDIRQKPNAIFLDTGSPHHVQLIQGLSNFKVVKEGARLRYGLYGKSGSNINFVQPSENGSFTVRTYERGVEDETLSCGTGVTAVALAMHNIGKLQQQEAKIQTQGGELKVTFNVEDGKYTDVHLVGPAKLVYKGEIKF
ncbi:diaminopimelate epimerase [Ulvibacterium sp.]|uniref:diaminopimelate epimerase n=1 Tax=Ulvibacterium sp. TaxID=2665914 RepID=UPI00260B5DE9|nr:diaminopimelate epimerase [Ulvibacterium sp.]